MRLICYILLALQTSGRKSYGLTCMLRRSIVVEDVEDVGVLWKMLGLGRQHEFCLQERGQHHHGLFAVHINT